MKQFLKLILVLSVVAIVGNVFFNNVVKTSVTLKQSIETMGSK